MSTSSIPKPDLTTVAANKLAEEFDADVFIYNSGIYRPFDDEIISECGKRKRRTNAVLVLVTEGGDPDAAYRIGRCFQQLYSKFTCIVNGYCKSAGTMLAVAAHELVMSNNGELGPLDVQMTKKDEIWESESGLTVMSALAALHEKSFSAFEHFLLTTKRGRRSISFKMASELAVRLTTGLFSPIFQHIDPIHIGEASRAQSIGHNYGLRLSLYSKNISGNSLKSLVSQYPAHGFVIDRAEAEGLFNKVREPNEAESNLIECLADSATVPLRSDEAIRRFISDEKGTQDATTNASTTDSVSGAGDGRPAASTGEGAGNEHVAGRSATAS
jgi:hypothetical protein